MYRYCKVFPVSVLKMSLGEVNLLLAGGIEDHNEKLYEHFDLVATILNSPFGYRREDNPDKPFDAEYFIKRYDNTEKPDEYYELQARIQEAAGTCEQGWD